MIGTWFADPGHDGTRVATPLGNSTSAFRSIMTLIPAFLRRAASADPLPTVTDQFLVANVGTTVLLKACGFIEEQGAELVDVGEDFLRLRVGPTSQMGFIPLGGHRGSIDVTIVFRAVDDASQGANRFRVNVSVTLRPLSRTVGEEEFQDSARKLLWKLRGHFITCS